MACLNCNKVDCYYNFYRGEPSLAEYMFGYPVSFKQKRLYKLFLYLSTGQYKSDFTKIAGFNGKLLRTIIDFVPLDDPVNPFLHPCYLYCKWHDYELQLQKRYLHLEHSTFAKTKKRQRKLIYKQLAARTKAKQICTRA